MNAQRATTDKGNKDKIKKYPQKIASEKQGKDTLDGGGDVSLGML